MIINSVLFTALIISLITDLRSRKILNIVTMPAVLFGFVYHTFTLGWQGVLFSGLGFLVGFSFLLVPYLLGGMGAGDVKLMAAIGALTGASFVFHSFIYIALIGGVIGLTLIIRRAVKESKGYSLKYLFYTLPFLRSNIGSAVIKQDKQPSIVFPYGVAIALGTTCAFIWGG